MLEAIIKGIADMEIWKENECYGVFRVTPKKRIHIIQCISKNKELAEDEAKRLSIVHKGTSDFVVKKMTYLLDPKDFILLEDNCNV